MSKVTQLANGRTRVPTQAFGYTVLPRLFTKAQGTMVDQCRGPRKERSRFSVGTEEKVLPEQGQSAASIEETDAVLEQEPQL